MKTTILPHPVSRTVPPTRIQPGPLTRLARQLALAGLQQMNRGRITLIDRADRYSFGADTPGDPHVTLRVQDPRFWTALAFGGHLGACEAYIHGQWTCDDLVGLVRLMVLNRPVQDRMDGGAARLLKAAARLAHALRRNTRTGSRRNIAAHYDLGNDFFALMLDSTMMYSCGIFERSNSTLFEASQAKNDRLCRKLRLSPADHLLEIGTGWGGFAMHAAGRYGCRVTTTTLSQEQYNLARRRINDAGLGDRIEVLLTDYRDLSGRYDKLVSIEMIEAVGHAYLGRYFADCARLLKPDGQMALQAITIADSYYEQARRDVDFIKAYIFPGSCIPSVTALCQAMTRHSDLRLVHLEDITPHYARTLHSWRENFLASLDEVRRLGYSEEFIRMWELYLCYCEGGFLERYIGNVQMVLAKPGNRDEPILPGMG